MQHAGLYLVLSRYRWHTWLYSYCEVVHFMKLILIIHSSSIQTVLTSPSNHAPVVPSLSVLPQGSLASTTPAAPRPPSSPWTVSRSAWRDSRCSWRGQRTPTAPTSPRRRPGGPGAAVAHRETQVSRRAGLGNVLSSLWVWRLINWADACATNAHYIDESTNGKLVYGNA